MNKYKLTYPQNVVAEPLLAQAILKTGITVNIIGANVSYEEGEIIITVVGGPNEEKKIIGELKRSGVCVEKIEKTILKDADECVDCGLCIGVCPVDAITMGKDYVVEINEDGCIFCNACVEACPHKAITIKEADKKK